MLIGERLMYGAMIAMVVGAISWTAWLYLGEKEYPFIVEAACDPSVETCFHRACSDTSNTGDCPPNALEDYK
ncbi:MAG TPA: hypothetical protein VEA36_00145, partial [Candidatus Paceibacterota bacterium]|nr:hypothetical protein [Candidatus Paceibacterota bacterium]